MANYNTCKQCGAPLGGDDIAIYRKLVHRAPRSSCASTAWRPISSAPGRR